MAERRTKSTTVTEVRHVATPLGKARENGPHLGDLRAFVAECAGLPDDVLVRIRDEHMSESGRRDVTFSASYQHLADEIEAP